MDPELTPEDRELLALITKRVRHFEDTLGTFYRDGLWNRMDRLYHNFDEMRTALRGSTGRARGDIYGDFSQVFGHNLRIPHAYAITETVLPALVSNRPRILILPGGESSNRNVQNMKALVDKQQSNIGMELKLQSVAKSGLRLGLGVGISYWKRHEGKRQKVVPSAWYLRALGQEWAVETCSEPLFDDPTFEPIPVRCFGWDPFGANIDGCRYAYHVNFRDPTYVRAKLEDPNGWTRVKISPEELEVSHGSADRYRKSVEGQFEAQGIPVPNPGDARDTDVHEVIEYHDRGQVVTVLDRKWIVAVVPNETNYGRLPFHIFRPTEVDGQLVGKGEIEPVADLIRENDQIRTDRRWAAALALNPVLFYNDGLIDPDQIKVGPGELNAVNGDPRDIIWKLEIPDVPQSSVRETAEIVSDIVRASGISDAFAGGESGSSATATGIQLELARASARIQNKTRRLELETIKPIGEHWVRLNQRHILEQREIAVPAPPSLDEPDRAWSHYKLGPNELAGKFEIEVDGGSTTPENVPQKRQDAQIKTSLMASPAGGLLDPRQWTISILEDLGMKNPEAYLNQGAIVPPETLQLIVQHLAEMGVDPNMAQQLVEGSMHEALDMRDQQAQGNPHGAQQGGQAPGGEETPPEQPDQQQAA